MGIDSGQVCHGVCYLTDVLSAAMVERYAREEAPLIGNAVTTLGL
ncbi:hypothetical protein [Mycobacteroides abscessus]|nr:hypothetical protein [Mycobacteroides abscessus]MDO3107378.1 hypothetical protein [Mycobacteroides abscessus subsp. abscessus]